MGASPAGWEHQGPSDGTLGTVRQDTPARVLWLSLRLCLAFPLVYPLIDKPKCEPRNRQFPTENLGPLPRLGAAPTLNSGPEHAGAPAGGQLGGRAQRCKVAGCQGSPVTPNGQATYCLHCPLETGKKKKKKKAGDKATRLRVLPHTRTRTHTHTNTHSHSLTQLRDRVGVRATRSRARLLYTKPLLVPLSLMGDSSSGLTGEPVTWPAVRGM